MFLSLPSIEKGRTWTGYSLSSCFGHESFHLRNKFLPNATEQPQTQQPRLQPRGGTVESTGMMLWFSVDVWQVPFSRGASESLPDLTSLMVSGNKRRVFFSWCFLAFTCQELTGRTEHAILFVLFLFPSPLDTVYGSPGWCQRIDGDNWSREERWTQPDPPALPAPLVILTLCSSPRAKRAYFFLSVNFREIKIAIGVTPSSCGNLLGWKVEMWNLAVALFVFIGCSLFCLAWGYAVRLQTQLISTGSASFAKQWHKPLLW